MKKSLNFILLLAVAFLINISDAYAEDVRHGFSNSNFNECVKNNTCLILCGYTNQVRYTADAPGIEAKYNYFSSYVYYSFTDKKIYVEYLSQEKDKKIATHSYAYDSKYVFFEASAKTYLSEKGVCPKKSYVDTSGWSSEVCFSGNSSFCSESNNAGTKFQGTSTLEYDYLEHVQTYFEKNAPKIENYTCDDLRNKTIDIKSQFVTDFSKNFLYGYEAPTMITNSDIYSNGIENLQKSIDDFKDKCDKEVEENDELSDEEKEELLKKNNLASEDLQTQVEDASTEIVFGYKDPGFEFNADFKTDSTCESYLGDPENKEQPAYYLQFVFDLMKYAGLVLLFVLTIVEFVKATASSNQDAMKKAANNTVKRLIIAIIIFFLPDLIEFVLELFGIYGDCGIS